MPGKTLIIQIPCYNEARTLRTTLDALPREVAGFARVEWLIIDDGSTDDTLLVAEASGVDHIVRLPRNQGLASAYSAGIATALEAGADVIVNTDADNQYQADDIPRLTAPVLAGEADIVIGARPIRETAHFSPLKKMLQQLGSRVVRFASRTAVVDAPSGFRALSRRAARELHVHGDYTYTLETIIQAGQKRMTIASVPVRTNDDLRPSRLVRSVPGYVARAMMSIARSYVVYRPLRFFGTLGGVLIAAGAVLALYQTQAGEGVSALFGLLLGTLLIGLGVVIGVIAVLADLIAVNRRLLEKLLAAEGDRTGRGHRGAPGRLEGQQPAPAMTGREPKSRAA
jgi:glycosyltransferase involved in cell wall biosynthesis